MQKKTISYLLKGAIFATGLSGIVAEYSLSTLASYFLGDTILQWTLTVSLMLFAMGVGSRISRTLKGNLSGNYPEYAREQLDAIENGTANLYKFVVKTGKRYYKIVQQEFETWEKSKYYGQYRDGSVHCFVDKETGDVFKAASWSAPAKHVRFSFQNEADIKFLLNPDNVGWAGGYLYIR